MLERPRGIYLTPSTVLFGAAITVAALGAVFLAINLVNVLVTVFLAITFAETIRPPVAALERRGVPPILAIVVMYLLVLGVLLGAVALLVPPLFEQARALGQEAPAHAETLRQRLPGLDEAVRGLGLNGPNQPALTQLANQVAPVIRTILFFPAQVVGGIVTVFSGLVLAAFWLGLPQELDQTIVSRLPANRRDFVRSLAADLSQTLGGWLRGQLVLMLFVGGLSFVGLLLLGVRYPVALAVWAGVTEIFPIVGPWVGAVPALLVAAVDSPGKAGLVFLLYLGVQQVENNFLVPKVMQQAVGLHPFVVLLALLVGGSLLGIAGVIIAVPAAATIQVIMKRVWLADLLAAEPEPLSAAPEDPPTGRAERASPPAGDSAR